MSDFKPALDRMGLPADQSQFMVRTALADEEIAGARRACAAQAQNNDELEMLLDMLGIGV